MLSLSSLIEFLLDLLRDEATQAEFARDPQAMLAAHGLAGVTAQDIRDAQPMLADVDGVQCVAGDGPASTVAGCTAAPGTTGPGAPRRPGPRDPPRDQHVHGDAAEVTNVTQEYTYNAYTEFSTTTPTTASRPTP